MTTAITAIKANLGITAIAYLFTVLAALWSIMWAVTVSGTIEKTYDCDANGQCSDPNYGYLFLLFLSYFFGHQVIQVRSSAGTVAAELLFMANYFACVYSLFLHNRTLSTLLLPVW